MQKKTTGLGRGLDDLLDDNALSKRQQSGRPLVESRGEAVEKKSTTISSSLYEVKTKTLYEIPEAEIIRLSALDVVATSNDIPEDGGDNDGEWTEYRLRSYPNY